MDPFRFMYPWQDKGKPVRGQKNNKEELLAGGLLIASLKTTANNKTPRLQVGGGKGQRQTLEWRNKETKSPPPSLPPPPRDFDHMCSRQIVFQALCTFD